MIEFGYALKINGYKVGLEDENSVVYDQNEKKKRKRNITWYNPPCSANVKTNIGKKTTEQAKYF